MCTVPGGLILYCTALFCTVLYKKRRMKEEKIRKFAYTQTKNNQTSGSKTETTLILSGYSRELANITFTRLVFKRIIIQ